MAERLPIFRLVEWMVRRRERKAALCKYCHKQPRIAIDGETSFCSAECQRDEQWARAIGG